MTIRTIADPDWPTIMRLETECYSELEPESLEVLQSKWLVAPEYCFIFEKFDRVIAYLLAHPWGSDALPPLYQPLDTCVVNGNNAARQLFLHDLVVNPAFEGNGVGSSLVKHLVQTAKLNSMASILLIAVEGAEAFWRKHNFIAMTDRPIDAAYGNDAVFMQLALSTH